VAATAAGERGEDGAVAAADGRTLTGRRLRSASGTLRPQPPFDFAKSLAFLGTFPATEGEQTFEPNAFTKALRTDGATVAFRVQDAGTVREPRLDYRVLSGSELTATARQQVVARIASFLSLDDDLEPFYALAADDPALRPVVERLYGLHQVRFLTPFENACWAVLSQRIPIAMARRLKQALVERFGGSIQVDGVRYRAFPEPADLLGTGEAEVSELIRNDRKARHLTAVARAFAAVDEDWLRTGPHGEVETWLRSIEGVGNWSAAFVLFRGLGRGERLPTSKPFLDAAHRIYGPDLEAEDVRAIAERYGPWRGYWALYLRAGGMGGDEAR
jgi:DNA-3-methyladenine glycosylase II